MNIQRILNESILYLSGAIARIFGPTDDAYPPTGVQPFEGEPFEENHSTDW